MGCLDPAVASYRFRHPVGLSERTHTGLTRHAPRPGASARLAFRAGGLRTTCPTFFTLTIVGLPRLCPPVSLGRADLGIGSDDTQLFFDVCVANDTSCGTTFVPWHVGHLGLAFSRSEIVTVSSKGFLHFSQRNS
jgi:hypothetical protein